MALNFVEPERKELTPRITVFGVGGAGGNAVNNMIEKNLEGVEFVVANTDAQALQQSQARSRVQLGVKATEGLGAGARPSVGAAAAEETLEEIIDHLAGAHMCFITAGMGGGTGTGAAPIIAQAAREMGVLTVGVVTKPFSFEGVKRMRQAEEGVEALQKVVDTLIIIPNQNLFRLANEKTTFTEAFALADDVLYQGVKGVTDLMVRPGMINLDFADVRAVMDEMGKAMMGTGEASGEDRARVAAEKAIANPLLDEISLNGARGVLINITGGHDLTLFELDEAANLIREKVDPEANIIVGSTLDPAMEGMLRVSVVATGIEASADAETLDVQRRRLAEPLNAAPVQPEPEPEPVREAVAQRSEPEPHYEERVEPQDHASHDHARGQWQDYEAPRRQVHAGAAEAPVWHGRQEAPVQDEFDLDEVLEEHHQPQRTRRFEPLTQRREAAQLRHAPLDRPEPAWQPEQRDWQDERRYQAPPQAAPRAAAVQPSPETLRRLHAAVQKEPGETDHTDGARGYTAPRPAAARHPEPTAEQRPRFGTLGSLINRMTGQGQDAPAAGPDSGYGSARGLSPAPRPELRPEPRHDPRHVQRRHAEPDPMSQPNDQDDRIEMPAFLRRQAN